VRALTFLLERARRLGTTRGLRGAVQLLQTVVVAHILHGGQLVDAKVLVPIWDGEDGNVSLWASRTRSIIQSPIKIQQPVILQPERSHDQGISI